MCAAQEPLESANCRNVPFAYSSSPVSHPSDIAGNTRGCEIGIQSSKNSFAFYRKRARQQREERGAAEAAARKEELKRLKNVKKKELHEKLERIKEMAGSLDGAKLQQMVDLDDDFDPAAYDKQMREMFGEEYYEGGEEDDELLGRCTGMVWSTTGRSEVFLTWINRCAFFANRLESGSEKLKTTLMMKLQVTLLNPMSYV